MKYLSALLAFAVVLSKSSASPVDLVPRQSTSTTPTPTYAPDPTVPNDPENSLYPPAQSIIVNPVPDPSLIAELRTVALSVDRFTLLKPYGEQYIKFDFNVAVSFRCCEPCFGYSTDDPSIGKSKRWRQCRARRAGKPC